MKPATVLLTCVGGALSAEVVRALKAQDDLPVRVVGTDCGNGGRGRQAVDVFYQVPEGSSPGYAPRVREICQQEQVNVLIPYADEEVEMIAANLPAFDALGVRCAVSDVDTVRLLRHKARLLKALEQAGIRVPVYQQAASLAELQEAVRAVGFPGRAVIVKPCTARGGRRVWFLQRAEDWKRLRAEVRITADQPWLAMEHLPGPAYDVDVLCADSLVHGLSIRRRYNKAGVPFMGCVTEWSEPIARKVLAIAACLPLRYCVDIDLAIGEDREPHVLEVNPRMSGSILGSIAAGVNFPLEIVRMALGLPVASQRCPAGVETLPPMVMAHA